MKSRYILLSLILAGFMSLAKAEWPAACKRYPVTVAKPAGPASAPAVSAADVSDSFDVAEVGVAGLSLKHQKIGTLKISLSAMPDGAAAADQVKTVVLKDVKAGGSAADLKDVAFEAGVNATWPNTTAAAAATYKPAQDLQLLAAGVGNLAGFGGSKGVWTLRVIDLGADRDSRTLQLEAWTLVLCPNQPESAPAAAAAPTTATTPALRSDADIASLAAQAGINATAPDADSAADGADSADADEAAFLAATAPSVLNSTVKAMGASDLEGAAAVAALNASLVNSTKAQEQAAVAAPLDKQDEGLLEGILSRLNWASSANASDSIFGLDGPIASRVNQAIDASPVASSIANRTAALRTTINSGPVMRGVNSVVNATNAAVSSYTSSLQDESMFKRLLDRLDTILGVNSTAADGTVPTGSAAASGIGAFRTSLTGASNANASAANSTARLFLADAELPQGPIITFLTSLRELVNATGADFDEHGNVTMPGATNATGVFRSAAAPTSIQQSASGLGSGSILSSLGSGSMLSSLGSGSMLSSLGSGSMLSSLTGAGSGSGSMLGSLGSGSTLQSLLSSSGSSSLGFKALVSKFASSHPAYSYVSKVIDGVVGPYKSAASTLVQSTTDKYRSAVSDATTAAGIGKNYATSNLQDTVALFTGKSELLKNVVSEYAKNYGTAVKASGDLVSQALKRYSSSMIEDAKAVQDAAKQAMTGLLSLKSGAITPALRSTLTSKLSSISSSASQLQQAAGELSSDVNTAVGSLFDAYRSQVQAVGDVVDAGANSVVDKAQARSEASIDALNAVLSKVNDALDSYTKGAGPLVGKSLQPYEKGLGWMQSALTQLKGYITAIPDVDISSLLSGKGTGQQLQAMYQRLGGATGNVRGSKVLQLLDNTDRFQGLYSKLFPAASGSGR